MTEWTSWTEWTPWTGWTGGQENEDDLVNSIGPQFRLSVDDVIALRKHGWIPRILREGPLP